MECKPSPRDVNDDEGAGVALDVTLMTAEAPPCARTYAGAGGRRLVPQDTLGASPPCRDADAAGQQQGRQLARQAALRGLRGAVLEPTAYGGYKDGHEAWMAGGAGGGRRACRSG